MSRKKAMGKWFKYRMASKLEQNERENQRSGGKYPEVG